jgi:hypothetical protein
MSAKKIGPDEKVRPVGIGAWGGVGSGTVHLLFAQNYDLEFQPVKRKIVFGKVQIDNGMALTGDHTKSGCS